MTAEALDWNPDLDGNVVDLIVENDLLFAAGEFTTVGGQPRPHLAALTSATVAVPFHRSEPRGALLSSAPNPFTSRTTLRFSLARPERVTLQILDVMGREVATLIRDELRPAGPHRVEFAPESLPSGIYLSRLRLGAETYSSKMLHVE